MSLLAIDIRTVILLLTIGNLAAGSVFIAYRSVVRPERAYWYFTIGKFLQAAAWFTLFLRGIIPDAVSIFVGNSLIFIGFGFESAAAANITQTGQRLERFIAATALIGCAIFAAFVTSSASVRVVLVSLITCTLSCASAMAFLRGRPQSGLRTTIGLFYACLSIVLLARVAQAWLSPQGFGLFTSSLSQDLVFLMLFLVAFVGGVGFLLVLKERSDALLFESERTLKTIVETEPECVKVIDNEGRLRQMNRAGLDMIEADTAEQVLGKSVLGLIAPAYRAEFSDLGKRVSQGGSGTLEFEIIGLKGTHRWLETHAVPMRDAGGKVAGLLGVTRDITARKQAELARTESEEKFKALFQQAGEYAFILDPRDMNKLIIADANEMACQAHGLTREELIGKSITELDSSGMNAEQVAEQLRTVMAQGFLQFETSHRRKDGTTFPVEVTAKVIHVSGKAPLILSMERDLTERKLLEEARLNAQRMEALGTLAGGIAHDFNNVLAAIRGNADLASEDIHTNAAAAAESIAEIKKASARATDLVRRIMTFGRPKTAEWASVAVDQVVGEVLKLLRPTLPAGIELRTVFAPKLPVVRADASQVHEALINLTNNAAHSIGNRTGLIEYRTEALHLSEDGARRLGLSPGDYVAITVKDDGDGMDEATQRRIFDVFYTTKAPGEGSGLGLSVVYGIMKGHAGAVSVESALGVGSSFHLYFPVANEGGAQLAAVAGTGTARQAVGRVRGLRVIHVDDEQALTRLGRRVLERLGHSATSFSDPTEALQTIRADPQAFDLVITDLSMPRMSGVEFARALRSIRADLPVIMTTGNISTENEVLAREAGVSELVLKPLGMDQLAEAIERTLKCR